jgi:hypothetical protein
MGRVIAHLAKPLCFLGRHPVVSGPFRHLSALFFQQLGEWKTTLGLERRVYELGGLSGGDSPPPAFGDGFSVPSCMMMQFLPPAHTSLRGLTQEDELRGGEEWGGSLHSSLQHQKPASRIGARACKEAHEKAAGLRVVAAAVAVPHPATERSPGPQQQAQAAVDRYSGGFIAIIGRLPLGHSGGYVQGHCGQEQEQKTFGHRF